MNAESSRVELAPGYWVSRVIKGGWQLAGGHGAVDRARALDDMRRFVDAGVTTFDCADIYTGVEDLIGEFVGRLRAERGPSVAQSVQVHTKYVPDLATLTTLTRADVERAIDRSLTRLRVERLDLVQFHWWNYEVPRYVEVARWLDALRTAGKIQVLGVTNFDVVRLGEIVDAGVSVAAHQVQYSVVDRRPEHGMAQFCQTRGIGLLCYGALAGGFISSRYVDAQPPEPPLANRSLVKYRLIIEEFGGWEAFQRVLAALSGVGRKHGVGPGTIAIRYVLERPQVSAVIVGARNVDHLDHALAALSIRLDAGDLAVVSEAIGGATGPAGDVYELERDKGGPHAAIMRYNLNATAPR